MTTEGETTEVGHGPEDNHNHYTAELINAAIYALAHAGDDIRLGRYSTEAKRTLASGLEQLVTALREDDLPTVISSSRDEQPGELYQRPGLLDSGVIS